MKIIVLCLAYAPLMFSMENTVDNIMQKYKRDMRALYFNEVSQAHTDEGLNRAYDLFFELSDKEIAPGLTSVRSKAFYHDHSREFPDVAGIIVRFHNRVVQKAFDMYQDGYEVVRALEQVHADGDDRGYIIQGNSDVPVTQDEFLKKMAEVTALVKQHKPDFGMIDE